MAGAAGEGEEGLRDNGERLGLTVGTGGLPEQLSSLTDAFQEKWP
jgi:hypothetical protein